MIRILKSSFLWQFAGGFALGAIGFVTLSPAMQAAPDVPAAQVR